MIANLEGFWTTAWNAVKRQAGTKWTPAEIAFTVDGEVKTRIPNTVNQPMYLLANLAVGGKWPGEPDSYTRFPATMSLQFIHAYRQAPGECQSTP